MNKSGAFKKKRVYFSQISNNALRDETLSLKAKGLYGLIQSYLTLEDFTLYKPFLEKKCREGRKAFESAWKELKKSGYLVQEKNKDENGHFCWTYNLLDDISHTSKNHTTQKVSYGKRGIYNNTDLNNTDLNNTIKEHRVDYTNQLRLPFKEFKELLFQRKENINTDAVNSMEYFTNHRNGLYEEAKYDYSTWFNLYENWLSTSDVNHYIELDYEDSILLINKFFKTEFEGNDYGECDYSPVLYCNDRVKELRFYESGLK